MNIKSVVENKEKYEVELTIEIGAEEFEAGVEQAYRKSRANITMPGFRKGKAPRKVIEGMYGASVFYEDAVEELYPKAIGDAVAEKELDSVAPPRVEILTLGKEGFSFKATITVRPIATVAQYKGLEADKEIPNIAPDAVDNELLKYVGRATQLITVDREAQMGDTANIDYQGTKDGVLFDGGTAKGYDLELGSHTFIPGFEDQVVGMKAGETKNIDITFPDDYHAGDLAGQPVVFAVTCNEVKEKSVPELDDEFAKDVSEFDTLAEFKDDIKTKLVERSMAESDAKFRQALLGKLTDQIDIELPEAMVMAETDRLVDDYSNRLQQQGISLEMYCKYTGTTVEKVREELKTVAANSIKQHLALDAVVAAEKIEITDAEVEEEIKKASANMNVPYERIVEGLNFAALKMDLARDKAMALVADAAKANMVEGKEVDGHVEVQEITPKGEE